MQAPIPQVKHITPRNARYFMTIESMGVCPILATNQHFTLPTVMKMTPPSGDVDD